MKKETTNVPSKMAQPPISQQHLGTRSKLGAHTRKSKQILERQAEMVAWRRGIKTLNRIRKKPEFTTLDRYTEPFPIAKELITTILRNIHLSNHQKAELLSYLRFP